MPSMVISEPFTPETVKEKKEKKMKKLTESAESDKKSKKKEKKQKSLELDSDEPKTHDSDSKKSKKKEKEKKRKAVELDDSDKSETSSELGEPVNSKGNDKSSKKMKLDDGSDEEMVAKEEEKNPNAVANFRVSLPLRAALSTKGIESLFPIQALTFDKLLDGADLVGRARTGQGKTLAFVLPILESLVHGRTKSLRKTVHGRPPSVLVLLPTRELAQQVAEDFKFYGGAVGLTCCCVYGGASIGQQQGELRRGVDVVIGTPGRVKDLLERNSINFGSLQFRVLDEADEMLRMGFVEDVELILGKVEDVTKVQTVLFSATLPEWVKTIAARFLKKDKVIVDLVSDQKMKASTSIRHIVMPCSFQARTQLIPDVIRSYSSGGRSIIFAETKDETSQLAGALPGARAIHGDIQQAQREATLAGFRSGKFATLVATNVAARGLDISDVQLIIQCEPPRDFEAYIHRSGRTGRAGNTGVSVMLFDPRKHNVAKLEKECGIKFEHLSAPQPSDIAKVAGEDAAESILQIGDGVIPIFKVAAEHLLENSGMSAVDIVAKALAKAAGYTEIKRRSLLTCMDNYVTVLLECGREMYTPTYAFGVLRRFLPEEKIEAVKGLALTADKSGAVFDVPSDDVDVYVQGAEKAASVSVTVLKEIPRLQEKENNNRRFGGGWGGGRGGGNRFSGGRGGGYSDRRSSSGGFRFGGRGRGR